MPIYEFYCPSCHVLFTFLSRSVNTAKRPMCPRCGKKKLQRQVSLFAVTGRAEEGGEEEVPIDESKLESAMETLAGEAENADENDPRQAADLMRRMARMTGMEYGEHMEEALRRMEAGEDPDAIEQEMGELLDAEEPLFGSAKRVRNRTTAPARDGTLYEM